MGNSANQSGSHPISQKCDILPDFVLFISLHLCNLIKNSCGNVLNLWLTNLEAVTVSCSNTDLVKLDKFPPPLHVSLITYLSLITAALLAHQEAVVTPLRMATTLVYFTFSIALTGRQ